MTTGREGPRPARGALLAARPAPARGGRPRRGLAGGAWAGGSGEATLGCGGSARSRRGRSRLIFLRLNRSVQTGREKPRIRGL
jgi:hypothetical protein